MGAFVDVSNLLEIFSLNELGVDIARFICDDLVLVKVVADILLDFLLFLPVCLYVVLLFGKDILLNTLENVLEEKPFFRF